MRYLPIIHDITSHHEKVPGESGKNLLRAQLNLTSKSKKEIENPLTAGIDKMGHHWPLAFLGDEPARFDSAHVFAGSCRLQPALVGDLLQGKAGLGADQLQNPDPMLMGEGFGYP